MVKKISPNFYMGNVKTDFLSPKVPGLKKVKTTSFGLGPIIKIRTVKNVVSPFMTAPVTSKKINISKKINFIPAQKKQSSITKRINSSLVPKQQSKSKFIPQVQFLSPYPQKGGKKVARKDMNWYQAKQRNPKLNPFGDADKDKVINMFDCHPYDPRKDGLIGNIGSSISKGASSIAKAVSAPVVKAATTVASTVSKVYTSIDKSLGGALPGGVAPTSSAAKTVEKALTSALAPAATISKAITGTVPQKTGTGTGTPTISTPIPTAPTPLPNIIVKGEKITTPSTISPAAAPQKPTITSSPQSLSQKITGAYTAIDKSIGGILPGGAPLFGGTGGGGGGGRGGTSTPTTTSMTIIEPTKVQAPWDILVIKKPEPPPQPPPIKEVGPPRERYYEPAPVAAPLLTAEDVRGFFRETAGKYYRADRFRPENITATAEITAQQLPDIGIQTALRGRYPMILNINPNERTKIPDYILALKPTIIYTTNLPTRLAIMAPGTGTASKEYTEYTMRISSIPQ